MTTLTATVPVARRRNHAPLGRLLRSELRLVVERLLSAQMPVLSWWALANVLTRTATTLTVLSIIIVGTLLTMNGQATVGEMVTFMNFAGLIIARLEHSVSFLNTVVSEAPSLREFFQVWDTVPSIRDEPNAIDPGRLRGEGLLGDRTGSLDDSQQDRVDQRFLVREAPVERTHAHPGPAGDLDRGARHPRRHRARARDLPRARPAPARSRRRRHPLEPALA